MWKWAFRVTLLFLLTPQLAAAPPSEESLTEEETARHLRYLASDELMGRATGTPGNDQAARYIAEQFEKAGLKKLPGLDGYLQRIPLSRTGEAQSGTLSIGDELYQQGEGLLILEGPALKKEVPAVFSKLALPELAKLDLKGKLLLAPFEDPENPRSFRSALRQSQARRKQLSEMGAIGLIEIYRGPAWERLSRFLGRGRLEMASQAPQGSQPILHLLIHQEEGEEPASLPWQEGDDLAMAVDVPGRPVEAVFSSNVAGWVEGSDAKLRDQFVLMMAHYDHIGAGDHLAGATAEDNIFNGARDNGMGTVALISAAQSLARKPSARSVIFLAVTGEEIGLLGSRYYVENPPVPLEKTVFVLNSDTGGYTDTDVVTVMGLVRTTARKDIEAACADFGMEALPDPAPEQNFFSRSDNANFARKGVPAPTFSPGFRKFTSELMKHYHRPSDEVDENFDFAYLLRFSQAFARAARRVGDNPQQPRWVSGDAFEPAWEQLFGNGK